MSYWDPDYKETSKKRWDRANMATAATKLRVGQLDRFDAACASNGVTRYEAIRRFCLAASANPDVIASLRWKRAAKRK